MMGYALGRLTETFDKCELKKIDGFVAADDASVWVQDDCNLTTVFRVDPATGKRLRLGTGREYQPEVVEALARVLARGRGRPGGRQQVPGPPEPSQEGPDGLGRGPAGERG